MLIFKRNCANHTRLLANQPHRSIMFRVTVSCLNDLGQVIYLKTSGIKSHTFDKNGVSKHQPTTHFVIFQISLCHVFVVEDTVVKPGVHLNSHSDLLRVPED